MPLSYYESDRGVAEYLLLHYGTSDTAPVSMPGVSALLDFPVRSVTKCIEPDRVPANARALDLGCAVGRSTFELARWCAEVIGVEYSRRFVAVAERLRKRGAMAFKCIDEGELAHSVRAMVPREIDRSRIHFERGDAMKLRRGLGSFDVVLMANLIDRLRDPRKCLRQMPGLINPGGQLVLTSPYTWLPEYTPRKDWLGGFVRGGRRIRTFDTLRRLLAPHFRLSSRRDLPFLIREHARKFQLGVAEATVWIRK